MIENLEVEPALEPAVVFVVERRLPGVDPDRLAGVHRALAESARRLSGRGDVVRYLRCTFIPGASRCLCVFEADNADLVRRVNEVAQVPFDRIEEAFDFDVTGRVRPTGG